MLLFMRHLQYLGLNRGHNRDHSDDDVRFNSVAVRQEDDDLTRWRMTWQQIETRVMVAIRIS